MGLINLFIFVYHLLSFCLSFLRSKIRKCCTGNNSRPFRNTTVRTAKSELFGITILAELCEIISIGREWEKNERSQTAARAISWDYRSDWIGDRRHVNSPQGTFIFTVMSCNVLPHQPVAIPTSLGRPEGRGCLPIISGLWFRSLAPNYSFYVVRCMSTYCKHVLRISRGIIKPFTYLLTFLLTITSSAEVTRIKVPKGVGCEEWVLRGRGLHIPPAEGLERGLCLLPKNVSSVTLEKTHFGGGAYTWCILTYIIILMLWFE